ncbi:hypothetical protein ACWKWA_04835 [Dermacoccus abyssi]
MDLTTGETSRAATSTVREQLTYLLNQPDELASMTRRVRGVTAEQRMGHQLEWWHEFTFNMDAIAKGSAERLHATAGLGRPHDPSDLELVDSVGRILRDYQAKVVASPSARLSSVSGLRAAKYDGMGLLVPTDDLSDTQQILDRRLAMPDGPLHGSYRSVSERLTDRVQDGKIESSPIDRQTLADLHPEDTVAAAKLSNYVEQLGKSGLAGGLVGAASGAATSVAGQWFSSRDLRSIDWIEVAKRSSVAAVRQAGIAVLAQGISIHGQNLANTGSSFGDLLGSSNLPVIIARSSIEVGVIAHAWATGEIDAAEAASRAAETLSRSTVVWACSVAGQALIPVPVVGAVLGGVVGTIAVGATVQGLKLALLSRAADKRFDAEYSAMLDECERLTATAAAELKDLERLAAANDLAWTTTVLPALEHVQATINTNRPDLVLDELATLTRTYGGTPLFASMQEFDDFMTDPLSVLTLDLRRPTTSKETE